MPSLSSVKKTEEVLVEVLLIVNNESILSETDRNEFVGEVESLRKRLKEAQESELNSSRRLQSLLGFPSPRAAKCLEEARDLRERIKQDVHTKWRTRLRTKKSNALGLSFSPMNTKAPETGTPVNGTPGQASEIILLPRNIPPSSASEVSEPNVDVSPAIQNNRDYSPDLSEAINTPLGTSVDQSSDSSTPRRRPSPPTPRRMRQPGGLRILSETTSNPDTPRRAPSIARPAPPPMPSPRQSRISRSSITPTPIPLSPSFAQGPPNPAMIASINSLAQELAVVATSMAQEAHKLGRSGGYASTKTNCVEINRSTVEGLTMNNNAQNCSGAVIHKTVLPPQHPPQQLQHV